MSLSLGETWPPPNAWFIGSLEVFLNDMRYINPRFTYLLTYLLTPTESTPKRYLDRFSRFSTTPTDRYEDKQTDRQTTLQR